ncbi:MAG: hypothetical protein LBT30_04410 [Clostridiales bacterium]|jgi:hypothetical protein|nr:hypothetical protein [Clostridiales bacterium]
MKKIVPISVLLFIALGIISWIFINPQKSISNAEAYKLMTEAIEASQKEKIYNWEETTNWMAVYNQFYNMNADKFDENGYTDKATDPNYAKIFDPVTDAKRFDDIFKFRVVNVYGEKKNTGNYDIVYLDAAKTIIKNFGVYVREEKSYGARIGNAATIPSATERRTLYNKIIAVNAAAKNDKKNLQDTIFAFTDAAYSGNFVYSNVKSPYPTLQDYYHNDIEPVYGLNVVLAELKDIAFDDLECDFKEAKSTTNKTVTNFTFKLKQSDTAIGYIGYLDRYAAANGGSSDGSVFAGADYISIELVHGKVAQIMCYVYDFKPINILWWQIKSPSEPYTLNITYLGPKINKPYHNDSEWYKNVTDQY